MRTVLEISYCGTAYHGWQLQPNAVTVQGEINRALSETYGCEIETHGCSRTDAGVHAKSFFCQFDTDKAFNIERLPYALNTRLPEDISVLRAFAAEEGFHCRFSVKRKTYEYLIWNGNVRNALMCGRAWFYPYKIEEKRMERALKDLVGTHDFAAFMAQGSPVESTVRTIYGASVSREGDLVKISVTGNGFLYNMVRIIVGTLIYIANGKLAEDSLPEIISSLDRTKAGPTAAPEGLYLAKTEY